MFKIVYKSLIATLFINKFVRSAQVNSDRCKRFGGASCCPDFPAVFTSTIQESYSYGPVFVTFVPTTQVNLEIDNICYYATSLPDNSDTFLLSISRVYSDGRNQVTSYIITQPEAGVTRHYSTQCTFTDINFAVVEIDGTNDCNLVLKYRCVTGGDKSKTVSDVEVLVSDCSDFDVNPPVLGVSRYPVPVSAACIQKAKTTIRSFGLPDHDFITYPMQLPTKCLLRSFSYGVSNLQSFYNLLGIRLSQLC